MIIIIIIKTKKMNKKRTPSNYLFLFRAMPKILDILQ